MYFIPGSVSEAMCLCIVYMSGGLFVLLTHTLAQLCFLLSSVMSFSFFHSIPPRPWRRTSSGWNMTSRERPVWRQSRPEWYGWRRSWTEPKSPAQGSTMTTIHMVRQWAVGTQHWGIKGQETVTTRFLRSPDITGGVVNMWLSHPWHYSTHFLNIWMLSYCREAESTADAGVLWRAPTEGQTRAWCDEGAGHHNATETDNNSKTVRRCGQSIDLIWLKWLCWSFPWWDNLIHRCLKMETEAEKLKQMLRTEEMRNQPSSWKDHQGSEDEAKHLKEKTKDLEFKLREEKRRSATFELQVWKYFYFFVWQWKKHSHNQTKSVRFRSTSFRSTW